MKVSEKQVRIEPEGTRAAPRIIWAHLISTSKTKHKERPENGSRVDQRLWRHHSRR